ncbi:exported hypothetical protein [Agrobacterium tumefaciens str. Kerr 14]|uniref:Uncharacterized protein n=1 Tax=Agrobacterium tumefaciens str. Kerr 14 TaxID=1183424 RepID=A0A1S7PB75_AGRTU|nr:exported hypothetical protein [Agrobacterium tumefaciens str. Kerr 14]
MRENFRPLTQPSKPERAKYRTLKTRADGALFLCLTARQPAVALAMHCASERSARN